MTSSDGIGSRSARLRRTLTFWLRPAFVLRVVNRFQKIVGFDRSMALASSALTALIPLALLVASILSRFSARDVADRIVNRYRLTGGGADAVRQLLSFSAGADTSLSILGSVFLVVSALSFARAVQRLIEQAWELAPLSVRNTVNGLGWLLELIVYVAAIGGIQAALGSGRLGLAAALAEIPVTVVFFAWGGRLLSAKRLASRDLAPFSVIAAVLGAAYSVCTAVYLPTLFSSYATRYGPVGAVFAMITALFGAMLVLVGSCAAGREIADELDNIRHGRRPPDDEVSQQWRNVLDQARERWQSAYGGWGRRRGSTRAHDR